MMNNWHYLQCYGSHWAEDPKRISDVETVKEVVRESNL